MKETSRKDRELAFTRMVNNGLVKRVTKNVVEIGFFIEGKMLEVDLKTGRFIEEIYNFVAIPHALLYSLRRFAGWTPDEMNSTEEIS